MYKFDSVCDFVMGMYFSIDVVLGFYLLVHHSNLRRAGHDVPSVVLAGFAVLFDAMAVLMHAVMRIYLPHAFIFYYLLPFADLLVTSMLLLAGFSLLSSRYPTRFGLLVVLVPAIVTYLVYVMSGNMILFSVLTVVWLALIFVATVIRVRRFNQHLTFFYSNVDSHRTTWFVYILIWAFAVYPIYKFASVSVAYSDLFYILYSLSTAAMYSITTYKLVNQTASESATVKMIADLGDLDTSISSDGALPEVNRRGVDDYFTPEQQRDLQNRLVRLMEVDKLYLTQDLCVDDLAKRLGINASYFYYFMRDVVKSTFFDYVNGFRVEESKTLLLRGEKVEYIVYKVGFNSDNTFRRAFKKATGMTPSEWRASQEV